MTINKKSIILYMQLLLYVVISGFILWASNSPWLDIIAFVILAFGASSLVKFDIAHPYVWYSFVFTLYSIAYPIIYLNGLSYDINIYTKSLTFSQWLALVVFLLVVSPHKTNYKELNIIKDKLMPNKKLLTLVSVILIPTIIVIATGGYSHKAEIYSEGSFLVAIGFRVALVVLMLFAINLSIHALKTEKLDYKICIYIGILIFLMVFFSGERDLLIRYFVLLLLVYYIIIEKSQLSKRVILIGLISLGLLPFLSKFKYFGLTGEVNESNNNIFISFLTSDFQSASKNMQILLMDESSRGIFEGRTFFSALIRTFKIDKILDIDIISPTQWFNETYFSINRSGQGFTLVGEGYINFGYLGIILVFIFIGLIVKFIYSRSNKGIYYFSYYILSIPIFMYSIRADLANVLSPLIAQNLLIIVFIKIYVNISSNIKDKNSRNFKQYNNLYR